MAFRWLGLGQFRTALASIPSLFKSNRVEAHKKISKTIADVARDNAPGRTSQGIHEIPGDSDLGGIAIGPEPGYTVGTFFGASRRFGWYGAPKFSGSSGRQFDRYVGDRWNPGSNQDVPYHIGKPINQAVEETEEIYREAQDDAEKLAFPIRLG